MTPASVSDRVEYAWDADGCCAGVRPPGSAEWLLFDRADGALTIHASGGRVYLRSDGHVVSFGNGTSETLTLDELGRPARIEAFAPGGGPILDLPYRYDDDGRIEQLGAHRIAYDGDRVVDPGARDRATYAHDEKGRRVADGATEYRYEDGRLAEVVRDSETVVAYAYDEAGLRARRKANGRTTFLHRDPNGHLLAVTDAEGRAVATYIRDGHRCLARIDGPVGEPAAEWYHLDHTATAWAVTDAAGEVVARRSGPLDPGPGPFMGRFRDDATGFHDFSARDYDHASRSFTTPDDYTFDPDDPRLAGADLPRVVEHWLEHDALRDRYAFCLGDPVNNVDLDGHSAWWFFLTIPSSLVWAIPNTIIALLIVIVNFYAEVLGWLVWPFVMLAKWDTGLKYYPWGMKSQTGSNPPNPYDKDERDHIWFGLDASARLGVPWALFNGSFVSVGRAFTLGNIIFYDRTASDGDQDDHDQRYVVPKDPDTQLTLDRAVHEHEMQHTFQYSYLGPLFHCLPLAPLIRLVENAIAGGSLTARDEWWKKFDIGGATTLLGGALLYPLTFGKVSFSDVETWANPASWWQHLLPGSATDVLTQAINLNNWIPGVGIYEWDMWIRGGQDKSWFERNAGAWSGHTYGLVLEVEKDEVYVGEFTRAIASDFPQGPAGPPPATPRTVWNVTFSITPDAPLPSGAPGESGGKLDVTSNVNQIDLDKHNTGTAKVVNGKGLYFHATTPGEYTITGHGDPVAGAGRSEDQKVKVKDVDVTVQTNAFVGDGQVLKIEGDSNATYSVRFKDNKSGGTINGLAYTAGATAGTDVLEVVAHYAPDRGSFATYGDNGLAGFDYPVKEISIVVKEPTITPSATEVYVGGSVPFTVDHDPQRVEVTSRVPGSRYDIPNKRFTAGAGPITTDEVETLTFVYGAKSYPVQITIKHIGILVSPPQVSAGGSALLTPMGGRPPYTFSQALGGTTGGSIDAGGNYHAGSTSHPTQDIVTATDANGGRGNVEIPVNP